MAALERELRPIARALSLRRADLDGVAVWRAPGVVASVIGVGRAAVSGTERALDATAPERVLVVGVAGALAPWLQVGDVVVPETVVDVAAGTSFRPHGQRAGPDDTPRHGCVAREGILATVERLGSHAPDGAWAVDMETAAVAAACERRGVPWDVVRAISDLPGTLTPAIASLLRPDGRVDGRAVARLLARRPADAVVLARLGRDTATALRNLAKAAAADVRPS